MEVLLRYRSKTNRKPLTLNRQLRKKQIPREDNKPILIDLILSVEERAHISSFDNGRRQISNLIKEKRNSFAVFISFLMRIRARF